MAAVLDLDFSKQGKFQILKVVLQVLPYLLEWSWTASPAGWMARARSPGGGALPPQKKPSASGQLFPGSEQSGVEFLLSPDCFFFRRCILGHCQSDLVGPVWLQPKRIVSAFSLVKQLYLRRQAHALCISYWSEEQRKKGRKRRKSCKPNFLPYTKFIMIVLN